MPFSDSAARELGGTVVLDVLPRALPIAQSPGEPWASGEMTAGAATSDCGADALEIDRHVRQLNAHEAACRTAVGELTDVLCRQKAHHRLGFARLSDYGRERLGLSAREIESLAQVTIALRRLPATAALFTRGELSWTHTRLLAAVATPKDEAAWLERARECSGAQLAALARRTTVDAPADRAAPCRRLVEAALDETLDRIEGEPAVRFHLRCPPRIRGLFYDTVELARRVAGEPLPVAYAAEAIAAEALSGAPRRGADGPREPSSSTAGPGAPSASTAGAPPSPMEAGDVAAHRPGDSLVTADGGFRPWSANESSQVARSGSPPSSTRELPCAPHDAPGRGVHRPLLDSPGDSAMRSPAVTTLAAGAATLSPFELDDRLRRAVRALRCVDSQIGAILAVIRRHRLHRLLGFRSLAEYVRDRIGIAPRTARALLAAERVTSHCAPLRDAYRAGDLSRLQTLTLAPVVVGAPDAVGAAWVARARRITLRRLTDEVAWALARRDAGAPTPFGPPPLDARLQHHEIRQIGARGEAKRHIGAHGAEADAAMRLSAAGPAPQSDASRVSRVAAAPGELVDAAITFTGPASIVALFRGALAAFASAPAEPGWRSCERMLAHVCATWMAQPRHRDPIFERDGWRCTVPACSGRRNLHDHHVRFRSRGGDNRRTNRITVCAWHHLRAVHCGFVRGWGAAPDGIRWQLGIDSSSWALLDFLGDRYLDRDEVLAERRAHKRAVAARLAACASPG